MKRVEREEERVRKGEIKRERKGMIPKEKENREKR